MAKKILKNKRYKKSKKRSYLHIKAILSLALILLSLVVANISFLSYARDIMFTTISKDTELESVKMIALDGIEAIKKLMGTDGEDEEMINYLPPESFLPET